MNIYAAIILASVVTLSACSTQAPNLPVRNTHAPLTTTGQEIPSPIEPEAAMRQQLAAYQRSNSILREANRELISQVHALEDRVREATATASSPRGTPSPASIPAEVASSASRSGSKHQPLQDPGSAEVEIARLKASYEEHGPAAQGTLRTAAGSAAPSVRPGSASDRYDVLYRFSDVEKRDEFYLFLEDSGVSDKAKGSSSTEFFVYVGSFSSEQNALNRVRELETILNVGGAIIVSRN